MVLIMAIISVFFAIMKLIKLGLIKNIQTRLREFKLDFEFLGKENKNIMVTIIQTLRKI